MRKNKQFARQQKLVPISIAGVTLLADPNSIPLQNRQVIHGEYNGIKVNSPALAFVGDTAVLWPNERKSLAISMPKADLGLLSTTFLKTEGFNVTAGTGATS